MSTVNIIEEGEIGGEPVYVPMTDEDIRQLARDVHAGQVVGSWMLPTDQSHLMGMVFMPLMFMDDLQRKTLLRDGILHVYGHLKDALPRAVNGYPMFSAIRFINERDVGRVSTKIKALDDLLRDF